ncbi:hypothetical protein [Microcoleus sp. N3A4]|uniref:hypothetical protein n=1 Tax=Microcoleus sp. N3A4 TaxID=3055379 RepID=UPI002FCF5037
MLLKYKLPNLTTFSQSAVAGSETTCNTIPGFSAIGICAKPLTIDISWQFPETDLA